MTTLNFDVDDNGSEGMGVEIYCNKDDGGFIGIHLYSDTGSGICHFEGENIDKLLAAFEAIKKELRPLGIKEQSAISQQPLCGSPDGSTQMPKNCYSGAASSSTNSTIMPAGASTIVRDVG